VAIWKEVLKIEQVGMNDNFFDLGGNSLLSIQVIMQIKKETGCDITPREFIFKSLGQIAAICEGKNAIEVAPDLVPVEGRDAFFFGKQNKQLFGCYHQPSSNPLRDCAVLLCYPMGQEYIRSHRTFTQMAVHLAKIGFPVLRFDFYGCGDSAGQLSQSRISQWSEDISTAIYELRKKSRIKKICLCGLRLGGTLSIMAGTPDLVDSLVLWNPIVNGKNYLRELRSLHKETLENSYTKQDCEKRNGSNEFLGHSYSDNILNDIDSIDLLSIKENHISKTLFIKSGHMLDGEQMKDHLMAVGVQTDYRDIPGRNVWLDAPSQEIVQLPVIQTVVSWLSEAYK